MLEQRAAREAGRVFQCAQRPAALASVEVDPVAGVRALERDNAGAVLARRIAADVGEPPLVAVAPAVRKMPRHPVLGGVTEPADDLVEIVAGGFEAERAGVVQINQGSRAPARRG